ncbi:MAG: hypothetical protein ABSG03_15065 [Bryobacteraceae bacterium]|jgi:hypothetical protein
MINNVQLYLAIGLPILGNAAMFGLLSMYRNVRFDSFERRFDVRFDAINQRFDDVRS